MTLVDERVPGREPITIVELELDRCELTYGVAPCEARLGFYGGESGPVSAVFDGTNDYLTRGATLTGAADSKLLTCSIRFKVNALNGGRIVCSGTTVGGSGTGTRFVLALADSHIQMVGINAAAATILSIDGPIPTVGQWYHVLFSVDLSDTNKRHFYINDVSSPSSFLTYTNDTMDFTYADWAIGATAAGGSKFNGELAEVYFSPGVYIDLSVEANRREFISSIASPVYLGADGSVPTGAAPLVFLSGTIGAWHTNKGTGGGFTKNGALVEGIQAGTHKCFNSRQTCQDTAHYTRAAAGNSPTPESITTQTFTSNALSHAVAMPATVADGDLLLVFLTNDGSATVTTPTDWSELYSNAFGTTCRGSIYAKIADGTEGGTTVDFVTSAVEQAASHVYRILEADWYGDLDFIAVSGDNSQSTQTPDPPALTLPWGISYRSLLIVYRATSTAASVTTYPDGYGDGTHSATSGGDNAGAAVSTASRIGWVNTEDPGIFTMSGSNSGIVATVAVAGPHVYLLRFTMPNSALTRHRLTAIPSVLEVSTRPTLLNLGGQDENYGALGRRAECTVTFIDHPHRDLLVDPYLDERDYDPLARGTFWTKFLARHPFYQNRPMRVREGYIGQELDEMTTRAYIIERIDGPDQEDTVKLIAKDVLKLADDERALAPTPNTGRLETNMVETDFELTLHPSGIGDDEYAAEGILRIGGELMSFTRSSDTVSIFERGLRNTTVSAHDAGDTVQEVLVYDNIASHIVINELLETYGGVPDEFIPFTEWDAEAGPWSWGVSAWLTEPTGVNTLVGEITSQTNCTIWWDERDQEIKLLPIRPVLPDDVIYDINEEANILADALSVTDDPAQRTSRALVYYKQTNPADSVTDETNYVRRGLSIDEEGETPELYGEQRVRKILSRWLVTAGQALSLGYRMILRNRDNPRFITFELDAKDREIWTGDLVDLTHRRIVDPTGEAVTGRYLIIEAEEIDPGHRVRYQCRSHEFTGRFGFVMEDGTSSYADATDEERAEQFTCWIAADENGFPEDGSEPYTLF